MSGFLCMMLGAFPSEITDPQFKNTVLLIHADGTNGAQNNTFIDSSSNNFSITRNGNATQGTFSPFSKEDGKWGVAFDGSGDYLSIADNAALEPSNSNFVIEWWYFPTSFASNALQVSKVSNVTAINGFLSYINTSGVLKFNACTAGSSWDISNDQGTLALTLGAWNHCAIVRSGSTWRTYVNGASSVTFTSSATVQDTANTLAIGAASDGTAPALGYFSNVRFVKGSTIPYDPSQSTITVPTSPLTAVTNTSLLCCQSNRFIDNSSNAFTLTPNGNVSVTPFSPFANSAAYSASVNGGSGYFDGSGDYLGTNTAGGSWGSGAALTLEAYVYMTAYGASSTETQSCIAGKGNIFVNFGVNASGYPCLTHYDGTQRITAATTKVPLNSWTHVAAVVNSGGITYYVNGQSAGTATWYGVHVTGQSEVVSVGQTAASNLFNGYISGLRVSTTNRTVTVPTSPYSSDASTNLLLNFTNAAIYDQTQTCDLETVGNAQISTSVKKYGTGSLAFDGTDDRLVIPSSIEFDLKGDFTIECWVYCANFSTDYRFIAKVANISSYGSYQLLVDTSGYPKFYASSAAASWDVCNGIGSTAISATTWAHLAVVRSGSTFTIYVNGTSAGTTTSSATLYYSASVPVTIGGMPDGTRILNGYIDDLRISRYARYTSNFTPPTGPFADR